MARSRSCQRAAASHRPRRNGYGHALPRMTGSTPTPKPWIVAIAPYVPGRSTTDDGRKVIKLSSNENPLGTSPAGERRVRGAGGDLERYPDAGATELREAIGGKLRARSGADHLRHRIGRGAAPRRRRLCRAGRRGPLRPLRLRGLRDRRAPRRRRAGRGARHGLCDRRRRAARRGHRARRASSSSPIRTTRPAPTRRARRSRGCTPALPDRLLLVVDQAYAEYLDAGGRRRRARAGARRHANVLVTRTFSKIHGLAAERIGWGYGRRA